jgi:tetratricopeptide (TPR) repeat protein
VFAGTSRFEVRRRIGSGGMGVVYEAYDRELESTVALKTLREVSAEGIRRFKREFRALAELDHPNLVRLGELFSDEATWFFTMELVRGVDFVSYVALAPEPDGTLAPTRAVAARTSVPDDLTTLRFVRGAPAGAAAAARPAPPRPKPEARFDENVLRAALAQLVAGVAALHDAGKVHRDIKPSNILVEDDGRVVLLDFGLVAEFGAADTTLVPDDRVVGTVAFMAPEQALGSAPEAAMDWYAVGVVLYGALTGRFPFQGEGHLVLQQKVRVPAEPPGSLVAGIPRDLDTLCTRLLEIDPVRRPSTAEMAALFQRPRLSFPALTSSAAAPRPLVGRAAELALLLEAFARTAVEGPVAVVVGGASGIGKTALVARFLREIGPETMTLAGRCYERETIAYKAFDGIVSELSRQLKRGQTAEVARVMPRDVALLARLFPEILLVPAAAHSRTPSISLVAEESRRRAFAALRELLDGVARAHALVLFIDDLQWADAGSLHLFDELMLGLTGRILIVAAIRTGPGERAEQAMAHLAAVHRRDRLGADASASPAERRPTTLHVDLGPLPERDARALFRLLADERRVDVGARGSELVAETDGHPMFIDELVRSLAGGQAAPSEVPRPLDEILWQRASALEAQPRRLLEVALVAGAPLEREVVLEAAEIPPAEAERWLNVLRLQRLVAARRLGGGTMVEPFHDRIRETVTSRLSPEATRAHHFRLAVVLEARGIGARRPELLVRHLVGAGEHGQAAPHAERAGALAFEALDFDRAADCYRLAVEHGEHDPAAARQLRSQLALALRCAGRVRESAAEFSRAAEGADLATRLELQSEGAQQLLLSGDVAGCLAALAAVLRELDTRMGSTPRAALLSLVWQRLRLRVRGVRYSLRDTSEVAPSELAKVNALLAAGNTLSFVDGATGADLQTRALLLALRCGERNRLARALSAEYVRRTAQGKGGARASVELLEALDRLADATNEFFIGAVRLTVLGYRAYFEGDYRGAAARFEEAIDCYFSRPVQGLTFDWWHTKLFQLMALRTLGRLGEALRRVEELLRDAARLGNRYMETVVGRSLAVCWLADDRPEVVAVMLERTPWTAPAGAFHIVQFYELLARIELGLYLGEPVTTRARVEPLLHDYARSLLGRIVACRTIHAFLVARLEIACGWRGGDRRRAKRAAARFARRLDAEGLGATRAWAALVRGAAAELTGETAEAAAELERAASLCEEQGMEAMAAVAARGRARLVGDGELALSAEGRLRALGVRRPDRFAAVYLPGPPAD